MNGSDLSGELLLATERLADTVERETECLRAARFDELDALKDEKAQLTVAYEARLVAFRGQPLGSVDLDPVTREALLQAGQRLRHAASVNARAIEAARSMTTQLLGAVAKAAAADRPQGYEAPRAAPRKSTAALSLSYDRRL